MNFISPKWTAPSHVKAVSTTRFGGVSDGAFAGLNLGAHVADAPAKVVRNRAVLRQHLGLKNEPFWLNQVHSTVVLEADGSLSQAADGSLLPAAEGLFVPAADGSLLATADGSSLPAADGSLSQAADGSYTSKIDNVCVIMTADCLPLLMTNVAGTQVAAIHVGWRGLADGIIDVAVQAFTCAPAEIVAWAGPCIGPNAFEIGAEVRDLLGGPNDAYKKSTNSGKYLADLVALTGDRLLTLGVENFSASQQCTYTDSEQFYSYRRDRQCGRMASLIWME